MSQYLIMKDNTPLKHPCNNAVMAENIKVTTSAEGNAISGNNYTMHNIFSHFLIFAFFFITWVQHWTNLNCKEENSTRVIRYHETVEASLQIGIRDKQKLRKESVTRNRIL